jgi:hypothetical protein
LDDADGGRARSGRWRDLAWFALLAVVFLALTLPVFVATEPARVPFARGEAHGFARALAKGPVALRGQWRIEEQPGAVAAASLIEWSSFLRRSGRICGSAAAAQKALGSHGRASAPISRS